MKNPKVSVIFPVYNGEKYVREAFQSILDQTFEDFELIVIDDGSTDNSFEILSQFKDPRIRLLRNEKNQGIIFTLNKAISEAKGEFLARMDADDISDPKRFAVQLSFLEKNPSVGVCGTMMKLVNSNKIQKRRFFEPESVKAAFLMTNQLVHPSVMMRRDLFSTSEIYSDIYPHAEDYALWISLLPKTKICVLHEVLLNYRTHANQVSRIHTTIQKESVGKAQQMLFDYLGIETDEAERKLHLSLFHEQYEASPQYLIAIEKWLLKLLSANQKTKFFNTEVFAAVIGEWWFRVNQELGTAGPGSYTNYKRSPLSDGYNPATKSMAKLWLKSVLRKGKKAVE